MIYSKKETTNSNLIKQIKFHMDLVLVEVALSHRRATTGGADSNTYKELQSHKVQNKMMPH